MFPRTEFCFDSQFISTSVLWKWNWAIHFSWAVFSPFSSLADIHLVTKHKLIEIVMVTCIDAESIYLCVWLNFCINRLPSANLIWILVAGMESSIKTGALRMDFSSSSGEEGVLTISGVRLKDWKKTKPDVTNGVKPELSDVSVVFFTEWLPYIASTNEQQKSSQSYLN